MFHRLEKRGLSTATLALVIGLGGCGSGETVGERLGYELKGPDEMAVIKRPPLTVPPDYNLRPPRPGESRSNADDASRAARETLVGPSSELPSATGEGAVLVNAPSSEISGNAGDRAKATLLGQESSQKSPPRLENEATDDPPSAGQSALLSHSNRVERNVDALNETRAENRIDSALLRRLLAFEPTPEGAEGTAEDGELESQKVVQIVRREQTPVTAGTTSE